MRLFEGEAAIIADLRDESELIDEKRTAELTVQAVRHPTLGKLVLVIGPDGSGVVVETAE